MNILLSAFFERADGSRVDDPDEGLGPGQVVNGVFLLIDAVKAIHLSVRSVLWVRK
jgi:hypothetical protein